MRTYQQQYLYQQLESIESATATSNPLLQRLLEIVKRNWTRLGNVLASSEQPQSWQVSAKNGRLYWKVYEFATT